MSLFRRFLALFVISDADRYRAILADVKREEWADAQARTRCASPAEMRTLLAACKDDYQRAEMLLRLWDLQVRFVSPAEAWSIVLDAAVRMS